MKTDAAPVRANLRAPFEIKSIDEGAHSFRGLAATWEKDLGDDVIHKGAFKRTLDHWRSTKQRAPIPLLDHHSRFGVTDVIGKMTEAVESDAGLEAVFEMVPDDEKSAAAFKRLKGGFITGLSIGYTPVVWDDEKGAGLQRTRHLKEIKLHEVSLVVFPMNPGARIESSSIKSLLDAIRAGTMTDDDRAALLALSDEHKTALRALLDAPTAPAGEPPAVTPKELAPDDPARLALSARLRSLRRTQLALT